MEFISCKSYIICPEDKQKSLKTECSILSHLTLSKISHKVIRRTLHLWNFSIQRTFNKCLRLSWALEVLYLVKKIRCRIFTKFAYFKVLWVEKGLFENRLAYLRVFEEGGGFVHDLTNPKKIKCLYFRRKPRSL